MPCLNKPYQPRSWNLSFPHPRGQVVGSDCLHIGWGDPIASDQAIDHINVGVVLVAVVADLILLDPLWILVLLPQPVGVVLPHLRELSRLMALFSSSRLYCLGTGLVVESMVYLPRAAKPFVLRWSLNKWNSSSVIPAFCSRFLKNHTVIASGIEPLTPKPTN